MSETRESRFENRDKRRKANLVLNILIGIVLVLIVVVASSLMMNSPKEQAQQDVSKNDSEQTTEAPASNDKKQTSDEDIKDKDKGKQSQMTKKAAIQTKKKLQTRISQNQMIRSKGQKLLKAAPAPTLKKRSSIRTGSLSAPNKPESIRQHMILHPRTGGNA